MDAQASRVNPPSGALTAQAAAAARHQRYRAAGWWPGEPLLERYLRLAAARPDALAVADSRSRKLSHAQLLSQASRFARELAEAGVGPGDIVLIAMPNCVEWQAMFVAVFLLDAVPATIPMRIDPANLAYVVDLIRARAVVVPDGEASKGLDAIALDVAGRCAHAVTLVLVATDGALRRHAAAARRPAEKFGYRDLDHVAFTSSTTGRPKAVMHSADTIAALNVGFSERFGLDAEAAIFMASPLGHSVGAYHGARLAMFNAAPLILQERWDPEAAIRMIEDYRCAFTSAATPFLDDLVQAPKPQHGDKLASLRWFLCGGAQVSPALMDRAAEEFPRSRVTVLWGMTEGGVTTCHGQSPREKLRTTAGVGLPGLELRTIDGNGAALPPGTEGELVMRGPGVFLGYLGQPDLYASLLTPEGFFRTGDRAVVDAEGYVSITGREKDLIIRGGVNISPVPIEDALSAHPNIASVAVIGAPDPRMGELLCAVIEPRGRRVELGELQQFIRRCGLPKYLAPERIHFVEAMPRTPSGKIRKVELRPLVSGASR